MMINFNFSLFDIIAGSFLDLDLGAFLEIWKAYCSDQSLYLRIYSSNLLPKRLNGYICLVRQNSPVSLAKARPQGPAMKC